MNRVSERMRRLGSDSEGDGDSLADYSVSKAGESRAHVRRGRDVIDHSYPRGLLPLAMLRSLGIVTSPRTLLARIL